MSNLDFLSMPLGTYIQKYLEFEEGIDAEYIPSIFSMNYFLKDEKGEFLNGKLDKKVWLLWAELRVNGDVEAVKTPTGLIPEYEDVKRLFAENLEKEYREEEYERQFMLRIPEHLARLERMEGVYSSEQAVPEAVWEEFRAQRERLEEARQKYGKDYVSPVELRRG